jgi:hypothetical protein
MGWALSQLPNECNPILEVEPYVVGDGDMLDVMSSCSGDSLVERP